MKSLEQQFRELIISNVPKNIDLMLPVSQDTELKTLLTQIYELTKATNEQIRATNRQVNATYFKLESLLREVENKKWEKIFWG